MSERRSTVSKVLTIGTVALAPPFVSLGLVLLVIWALTAKGGYFWPMWPYSAMLLIIGLRLVFFADHARPEPARRRMDAAVGYAGVFSLFEIAIWGMAGVPSAPVPPVIANCVLLTICLTTSRESVALNVPLASGSVGKSSRGNVCIRESNRSAATLTPLRSSSIRTSVSGSALTIS